MEELNPFLMITFADLKKFKYWYWCGFPAFLQKPGWEIEGSWSELSEEEVRFGECCGGGRADGGGLDQVDSRRTNPTFLFFG